MQYIAIFNTSGEWRPHEIEIHKGIAEEDDDTPDEPNPDEPNPDEPNPDEPDPDEPDPDEPDPDEPPVQSNNILLNMGAPTEMGVTTGTDYDKTTPTGGNNDAGLTDGLYTEINPDTEQEVRQIIQFWGGSKEEGVTSNFVFVFDLKKNYDLTKVMVDAMDNWQDGGVNQGIKSWDFYASSTRGDLFKDENKVTGKTGYDDAAQKSMDVSISKARYVALVVHNEDTLYGACRLTEWEVHGVESDDQTGADGGGSGGDTPADNNLRGHIASTKGLFQVISTGSVSVSDHGNFNNLPNTVIDGRYDNTEEGYTAFEWDTPQNMGVLMELDDVYTVEKLVLYSGLAGYPDILKVYASDDMGNLYDDANLIAQDIECRGEAVTVPVGKNIQYVAVFVTGGAEYGCWRAKEYEIHGKPVEYNLRENIVKTQGLFQVISNGSVSASDHGNFNNLPNTVIDGRYDNTEEGYTAFEWDTPQNMGVLMELDDLYAVEKVVLYSGLASYPDILKVYASDDMGNLYSDASLIAQDIECRGEAVTVPVGKNVRYVAVFVTGGAEYGCWRAKEYEIYGKLVGGAGGEGGGSNDEGPVVTPDGHQNLLLGLAPDHFGVTGGTDYEILEGTDGPHGFAGLTDGVLTEVTEDGNTIDQNVQFWFGKDESGNLRKFVFTYDLMKNYDLSKVVVDAWENYQDEGVNQGIESWNFYASRTREDLFSDANKIAGKAGYNDPGYMEKSLSLQSIRYVSFVFTIQDTLYGACRLTELELYGVESAEQDADKPVITPDEFRDYTTDTGVVVRIQGLYDNDDLSKLDIKVTVKENTAAADLSAVQAMLDDRYYVTSLFSLEITDANGDEVDLNGRTIRLLFPVKSDDYLVAVVDASIAELLNAKYADNYMMIDANNHSVYALLNTSDEPSSDGDDDAPVGDDDAPVGDNDAPVGDDSDDEAASPDTGVADVTTSALLLVVVSAAVMVFTRKAKKSLTSV